MKKCLFGIAECIRSFNLSFSFILILNFSTFLAIRGGKKMALKDDINSNKKVDIIVHIKSIFELNELILLKITSYYQNQRQFPLYKRSFKNYRIFSTC